tara:strand:- start:1195 stop:2265 length:1071 start_codon:yes stop_codon:yes gene_type:complete
MKYYLVGGAIRDRLLNLTFSEKDYVVIGETEASMLKKGFISVGKKFPVFLHPKTKEEFALARKEKKVASGHKGFIFETDNSISLEEDLSRRDLTINAIAEDEKGNLIDPFKGQEDLKNKILKHVSPAFSEDPLRIFRVARFATKLFPLSFEVDKSTISLMRSIPKVEIENLSFERIWQETEKILKMPHSHIYFETLHKVNALFVFPGIEKYFTKSMDTLKGLTNEDNLEKEKWAALNIENIDPKVLPIPKRFIRFEKYSRDFKLTLENEISPKLVLEALMKINSFRDKELALKIINFLQKNNKLNSSLISINLNWNLLLAELNSVSINEGFSENGELIKKEIYNKRLDIIKNYLNE